MPVVSSGKGARGKKKAAPARNTKKGPPAAPKATKKKGKSIAGAKKIQLQDLPNFSRQLAAMLSAGMPIVAALDALSEQIQNKNFKPVVEQVKSSIENGAALSEALAKFPSVFDTLYVNMVRGGETGGQLAETIKRLASFLENAAKLRSKVKGAMMYPTIVMSIALTITAGMILFIVPVFANMFSDFGGTLPGPTRMLMNLSNFMRGNWYILGAVLIGAAVGFNHWKKTDSGALALDGISLKAPIYGELSRKIAAARFARTFAQLIRSGVPILSALDIVSGATGNLVAGGVIVDARNIVEQGDSLSSAMSNQTVFPSMLVRMLSAGEKTGKIDEMMDNIADYYEDEVETALNGLTSMIEPLLMVFLGVVVGGILVAMFMPMFQMGNLVGG